ncbi:hypothetical protein HO173_004467 [Letharia columbiana]|uniref:Lipid droplet-associated hydrolase n=1 Tax=Letharia columbiana TaxID=112416 RepID=A0A8H6FZE0_9LECA|nr:uncharacterized protein HO173_004467 [Letharia columbiana]KAF6237577.1 hypothetical protein HO173_004467 [Letharia columbiana]
MSMSRDPLLGDFSFEKSDKICYEPSTDSTDRKTQDYLIYFLPGNPGLIQYYQPFLSRLNTLLSSSSTTESSRFHICGHTLRGFESAQDGKKTKAPRYPLGLEQQIESQEQLLYNHIKSHRERTGNNPKVILMGHSVGCYILLELIQQHRGKIEGEGEEDFDLIGGILLFPTITHIAKSPLGMVFGKILQLPYFPEIVGTIAKALSSLVPESFLHRLVKLVTRFPEYAATTTTSFIKSPMGVRQALHLAKDEMTKITDDQWDEEVWGAATSKGTNNRDTANSNLTFYWGKKDRWVATHTRDALIAARGHLSNSQTESGSEYWKPVMMVDNEGMPHDFCTTLRNSHSVAGKVKGWVDGIIEAHSKEIS